MASNGSSDKMNYIYNSQLDAFTLYHISHEKDHHSAVGPALPALGHATSGALGTAISKLITYPLDVVITRLQVQRQLHHDDKHPHYNGLLDAIEKIYEREGGPKAFYSGVLQETLKGVADSFLFFLAYSYVRQKRLDARDNGRSLPALEEIGIGVVAGAFSKLFTTPIQQIVTRKQTAAMMTQDSATDIPPLSSTRDIAAEIRREKGIQGFWSGYSASLILTLNPSITMLLHKALLRLLVPRAKRDNPGARVTFFLAAISKVLASTATYPFSLAKTRAQVSLQKPTSGTGETSDKEKSGDALKSKALQARQRTVFSTILRIAQTEGMWALYEGLGAEVLKGFFSHGITMLMKDRIHAVIISLYYMVQKALEKYPGPKEMVKKAADDVQSSDAYGKSIEVVGNATESVKNVVAEGSQQAQDLVEKSKDAAGDAYSKSAQTVETAAETASSTAQDMYNKGKQMFTQSQDAAGEAMENAKTAASDASQQARDAVVDAKVRDINGPDSGIKE
ncbi:peroxisomal adenine nucleotide transporter 1 [Pyrenophora tritici-repentis]|uniref:Peroxisomal adenine nucleotide transporter n=2 Tax=Pyrenophora tritici-repentis TaxID=45151 RepID=A0A2W1CYR8_9PLEO|nr:peroxisomal adenine nucleotide transporter 1 [Pyrenophora tritici-repentis Pt-1C-BFP]KAI0573104.1 Peroxisomal adenine nucleotide transporter 1 [Pyrenophora tritici-repentis]EDU41356.1 peroxisomal adenine nucleotide transporter 1 [Pyrenophora tritici-repentis Pt-1C-BFP]KAI0574944.1 Peroxisomal adenine nucleotide transporter 1 [Pyrenophora tritici-repentis]KAI0606320.1 Peroxisomal adenine nucleotide transporter 1 [Pyrenophora tritici-repentis]KAI0618477.1 Peroxisomal adenine nucleotide transp